MTTGKARDDKFFNCSQDSERDYVKKLYAGHEQQIEDYIKEQCKVGKIHYTSHEKLYQMIYDDLKLRRS